MNKELILIGGGYSIKEGLEKGLWEHIKGKTIWSLNFAFEKMPYLPTREIWVDQVFYVTNMDKLFKLKEQGVELVSKTNTKSKHINEIVKYDANKEVEGIYDEKKKAIFSGGLGLVGVFSLSLAIKEGYNNIYLLGYDFGTPTLKNKKTHFYQDELKVRSSGIGNPSIYLKGTGDGTPKKHVEDFERYLDYDVKIHNVSMISNIPYFKKIEYSEFFRRIK